MANSRKNKKPTEPPKKNLDPKLKKYISYLVLLFLGVVFSLVVLEILFRVFLPQDTYSKRFKATNGCYLKDPYMAVKLKPDCSYVLKTEDFNQTMHINPEGFRGNAVEILKPNNVVRIVMTGDSFVFGNGVDDDHTVPKVLENILNERKVFGEGKKVEVINGGFVGGLSPDANLVALRQYFGQYKPDIIIMGTFVYNDLSDMDGNEWVGAREFAAPTRVKHKRFEITDDGYLLNRESEFVGVYKNRFLRESNLAIFTSKNLPVFIDKVKIKLGLMKLYVPSDISSTDSNIYGIQFDDCIFGGVNCHRRLAHLFDDLLRVFQSGQTLVDSKNKKSNFLVVLEPADFQIYPDAAAKYGTRHGLSWAIQNASSVSEPEPQKKIKSMLEAEDISYLDLLQVFRQNAEPRKYYPNDAHWNELGTRLAAEQIAVWIVKNAARN